MSKEQLGNWAVEFIKTVGFPTLVACLLMWAMNEQITSLRDDAKQLRAYIHETMSKQLDRSNDVIDRNNQLFGQMITKLEAKDP